MKRIAILLLVLLAVPAFAQEVFEEPQPDYSRENLQKFVAAIPEAPAPQRRIRFYWGAIELSALGQHWRVSPVMPLSGSGLTTTQQLPDPFALAQTPIATPKRAWYTQRQLNTELKRIEKSERAKIVVKTK